MLNSSYAIQNEFSPRYPFSWYPPILLGALALVTYVRSKLIGEDIPDFIEMIGVILIAVSAYGVAHAIRKIEFGDKLEVKYVLWPTKTYDYKKILNVTLPKIKIDSQPDWTLENFSNMDELQQEFKDLEIMGFIQKGCVKQPQNESMLTNKPKLGNLIWATFMLVMLGRELFNISQETNILWVIVIGLYFMFEVFGHLDHIVIGHGRWVSLKERGLGFV